MSEGNRAYLTKEALRRALLQQIEAKDISHVKVSELVAEAHVSKATFYRYYKDVYDLLSDCFAAYLEVTEEIEEATASSTLPARQYPLTLLGMRKVREYPTLFVMCHRCSYGPFAAEFASRSISRSVDATEHYIRQQGITSDTCRIDVRQLAELSVDLSIATCLRWIEAGCDREPEEVAELSSLCTERLVAAMRIET